MLHRFTVGQTFVVGAHRVVYISGMTETLEDRLARAEKYREEVEAEFSTISPSQSRKARPRGSKRNRERRVGVTQQILDEQQRLVGGMLDVEGTDCLPLDRVDPFQRSKRLIISTLAEAHLRDRLTPAELAPFRERIAYRVVRLLLRLSGRGRAGDTLMHCLPTLKEWQEPFYEVDCVVQTDYAELGPVALVLEFLQEMVPLPLLVDRETLPQHMENLGKFLAIINSCLGLDKGTLDAPAMGRLGMYKLLENWPSPIDLVTYEQKLLVAVSDSVSQIGSKPTRDRFLVGNLGFSPWEAEELIQRSYELSLKRSRTRDVMADREIIISRYEDISAAAKEACDHTLLLRATREIAKVTGIHYVGQGGGSGLEELHDLLESEEEEMKRNKRNADQGEQHGSGNKTIG